MSEVNRNARRGFSMKEMRQVESELGYCGLPSKRGDACRRTDFCDEFDGDEENDENRIHVVGNQPYSVSHFSSNKNTLITASQGMMKPTAHHYPKGTTTLPPNYQTQPNAAPRPQNISHQPVRVAASLTNNADRNRVRSATIHCIDAQPVPNVQSTHENQLPTRHQQCQAGQLTYVPVGASISNGPRQQPPQYTRQPVPVLHRGKSSGALMTGGDKVYNPQPRLSTGGMPEGEMNSVPHNRSAHNRPRAKTIGGVSSQSSARVGVKDGKSGGMNFVSSLSNGIMGLIRGGSNGGTSQGPSVSRTNPPKPNSMGDSYKRPPTKRSSTITHSTASSNSYIQSEGPSIPIERPRSNSVREGTSSISFTNLNNGLDAPGSVGSSVLECIEPQSTVANLLSAAALTALSTSQLNSPALSCLTLPKPFIPLKGFSLPSSMQGGDNKGARLSPHLPVCDDAVGQAAYQEIVESLNAYYCASSSNPTGSSHSSNHSMFTGTVLSWHLSASLLPAFEPHIGASSAATQGGTGGHNSTGKNEGLIINTGVCGACMGASSGDNKAPDAGQAGEELTLPLGYFKLTRTNCVCGGWMGVPGDAVRMACGDIENSLAKQEITEDVWYDLYESEVINMGSPTVFNRRATDDPVEGGVVAQGTATTKGEGDLFADRAKIVNWMSYVCSKMGFQSAVYFLAVNLFDLYMKRSPKSFTSTQLPPVSATAFLQAANIAEVANDGKLPTLREFVSAAPWIDSPSQILVLQLDMLTALASPPPTPQYGSETPDPSLKGRVRTDTLLHSARRTLSKAAEVGEGDCQTVSATRGTGTGTLVGKTVFEWTLMFLCAMRTECERSGEKGASPWSNVWPFIRESGVLADVYHRCLAVGDLCCQRGWNLTVPGSSLVAYIIAQRLCETFISVDESFVMRTRRGSNHGAVPSPPAPPNLLTELGILFSSSPMSNVDRGEGDTKVRHRHQMIVAEVKAFIKSVLFLDLDVRFDLSGPTQRSNIASPAETRRTASPCGERTEAKLSVKDGRLSVGNPSPTCVTETSTAASSRQSSPVDANSQIKGGVGQAQVKFASAIPTHSHDHLNRCLQRNRSAPPRSVEGKPSVTSTPLEIMTELYHTAAKKEKFPMCGDDLGASAPTVTGFLRKLNREQRRHERLVRHHYRVFKF